MRAIAITVALALLALLLGLPSQPGAHGGANTASIGPVSQDFRASHFALRTGWMTFGQLWFAASR